MMFFQKAIYKDEELVRFLLLDEALEEETLLIWRILFFDENTYKGYGNETINQNIREVKESKNIRKY